MPAYKIMSPLTIAFFAIVFFTLFLIPEDLFGAVGAIAWTVIFGGVTYLHQKKIGT